MMKKLFPLFCLLFCSAALFAQPNIISQKGDMVKIMVSPQSDDFNYNVGEEITFEVALYKFGKLLSNETIFYSVGEEKQETEITGSLQLKDGKAIIHAGEMQKPGFLRCYISYEENGYKYENTGTAGVEPENIVPYVTMPEDFSRFWNSNLDSLAKIPMNPLVTLMPEKCTPDVNVYKVRLDNIPVVASHITRVYGILAIPRAEGKYPAILRVPGAGVRSYQGQIGWAEKGFITLEIGINGIPVDLYDSEIYDDLKYGALWRYVNFNNDDRDRAYMKRVYLSCVRAVDFLTSLEEYDGENLGVTGGSQGGALTMITAALDSRVTAIAAYYPALCDVMVSYHKDQAAGWPHLALEEIKFNKETEATMAYYDVVNFARIIEIPGFYAYGYNDNVCPATSICAALNSINAPAEVVPFFDTSHWRYKEEADQGNEWLFNQLKK